ncbi:Peptidoglycan/LPS O-acetylase OafA/YrhL, contains acyltransferase and SGNH-hydrolase domains [Corynebacterium appendicis CIP 107643]|uniref:Peptidoglycan/LPS O-acetylase OafA/YrhL, contains acyltransferase and SGNH-hydrolase domains n=2 Tax=Corynebacterium appendicis TaxID=163202 RepID=A0A1N7JID6_9CORY|nr:O-acetyltransferase OatA [Corynebacterium appendicis CIP 107643]SIS49103.1 Peptidoglycan/LPS O-acetylase OafA/YrhL, contains acyltransferase and SGNH-hydrolase domains [Corynebacterium appendicis CIP 107643]
MPTTNTATHQYSRFMALLYTCSISNTSKRLYPILPELEGLRAVAALGIVVTHVSFQTGLGSALFERFDFFVAVFFALSAFLLARGQARLATYPSHRLTRILPAYLVCAVVVMAALPSLSGLSWQQALANLFLVQVYVPDGLVPGLTQMWSLCIEVAFYFVLPLYLVAGQRVRAVLLAGAVLFGLAWPWLIDGLDAPLNLQIFPPSYAPWFAVGLGCAELERAGVRLRVSGRARWAFPMLALGVAWLAGQEWVGPQGLTHPSPSEFNARIILGTVFAALWLAPFALAPRRYGGVLASPVMRALGRWSYSIFLWHVAVLELAFPVLGRELFTGRVIDFALVLAFTVVVSVAVSYISYELVEAPAMHWLRHNSPRRSPRPSPPQNPPRNSQPATVPAPATGP